MGHIVIIIKIGNEIETTIINNVVEQDLCPVQFILIHMSLGFYRLGGVLICTAFLTIVFINRKVSDRKLQVFFDPGPSRTFLLLDMREDSIDMGNFGVNMAGWPDRPDHYGFWDLPGFYHNGSGNFAFADGHSEIKKWKDARTMPVLKKGQSLNLNTPSPSNPDVFWMMERSTRRAR